MNLTDVTVVVADDHPVFVDGLVALLESRGATIAGIAGDGATAVALVAEHQPQVVIMDLAMPSVSGIEATRAIVDGSPDARVLVVTMHDDDDSLFAAMRAGAAGYVLKGATPEEIITAVAYVAAGGSVFGAGVGRRVRDSFTARATRAGSAFPHLTPRELELLDLVAAGLDNLTIARRLGIAHKTVKNHVSSILTKLQVQDRGAAIVRARDEGLGRT